MAGAASAGIDSLCHHFSLSKGLLLVIGSEIERTKAQGFLSVNIHPSADVSMEATIGAGTIIWHMAQVRERAHVGPECIVGRGAYIGPGVIIGERTKIQNYALVYEPARVGKGVFIGPSVVLTNDHYPRAVTAEGGLKTAEDWEATGVVIGDGASIGAHATCIAPVEIGEWAVVAAGAVVTKNVAPYALVAGVPAKHIGWVGPAGQRLVEHAGGLQCPVSGDLFQEVNGHLVKEKTDV